MDSNVLPLISASALPVGQADDLPNSSQRDCPFLHMLPLEIRLMIYRYLLVGRNVKQEINMKSHKYDSDRDSILQGSDYSYCFHTSILGASQKIRTEAMDLFRRENTFISIILDGKWVWYCELCKLENSGVAKLARNAQARTVPAVGMTVNFGAGHPPGIYYEKSRNEQTSIVIFLEDLAAACISLQRNFDRYGEHSQSVDLRIMLSRHLGDITSLSQNGFPVPNSKLWECLDPLRNIRGTNIVSIDGLASLSYTTTIMAKMREGPPDVSTFMARIEAQLDQGDQALREGDQVSAIDSYKAALNTVRAIALTEEERHEVIVGSRFHDIKAGQALADTKVRLHHLLAEAYLRLGDYRLARVYVERIYGPLATYDDRANREQFPLRIPQDGASPSVYAELLLVAAKISLIHGHHWKALMELSEASRLDDSNEEIKELLDQTHECYYLRVRRRESIRDWERKVAERKFDALLQVVHDRASKGDQARNNTNFELAREKYIIAYDKARKIEPTDPHWLQVPGEVILDILSKLTTASLELHDFESVQHWAAEILAVEPYFLTNLTVTTCKDRMEYAREAFHTAYYSKAVVYQKQGNFRAAIQDFEDAFLCDGGCAATFYQLQALKRQYPEACEKAEVRLLAAERTEDVAW